MHRPCPHAKPHGRRPAFTLIELIVVVMVIGILASLILVAVNGAIARARVAGVVTEIKDLEKSIADFKGKYGIEPPSYFVFFENGAHWADDDATSASDDHPSARRSREILRKMWPNFLNTANVPNGGDADDDGDGIPDIDLNGDGDYDDVHIFNGSECLVFFLGGVSRDLTDIDGDGAADYICYGFSSNPTHPFELAITATGTVSSNRTQFYDFDSDRLVNLDPDPDVDDLPEFVDELPNQRRPYIYLSAYEGNGYRPYGADLTPNAPAPGQGPDDEIPLDTAGTPLLGDVYYKQAPAAGVPGVFWNQKSYQIISPGLDGDYGDGGLYNGETHGNLEDRDNITNFRGGELN